MTYTISIDARDTKSKYGVDWSGGFKIESSINLSGEVSKIKEILLAWVNLKISADDVSARDRQLIDHSPAFDGKTYKVACDLLGQRGNIFDVVKEKFKVKLITPT
jgi:hypothetical protein